MRGSAGGAEQGTPRAPTIEGSHPCPSRRSPKARQLPDQRLVLLTATHPMLPAPKFHLTEREPKPALITGGFGAGLGLVEPSWGRGAAGTGSQADTAALLIPSVSKRASCGRGEEAGRGGVHLLSCVTACPKHLPQTYLPVHHLQSAGRAKCEPAHPKNLTLSMGGASLGCYLLAGGAAFSC